MDTASRRKRWNPSKEPAPKEERSLVPIPETVLKKPESFKKKTVPTREPTPSPTSRKRAFARSATKDWFKKQN